jgi:hypothetical protein
MKNVAETAVAAGNDIPEPVPDPNVWAGRLIAISDEWEEVASEAYALRRNPSDLRPINDALIEYLERMSETSARLGRYYETFEANNYDAASNALREANRAKVEANDLANDLFLLYRVMPACTLFP